MRDRREGIGAALLGAEEICWKSDIFGTLRVLGRRH